MENVTVLGAGSWGTALAIVLAENGHNTLLWTHREDQAAEINNSHTNKKYHTFFIQLCSELRSHGGDSYHSNHLLLRS